MLLPKIRLICEKEKEEVEGKEEEEKKRRRRFMIRTELPSRNH